MPLSATPPARGHVGHQLIGADVHGPGVEFAVVDTDHLAAQVGAYERGGAAALSILTDETHFGGSLDDLRAARRASGLPILRKDFVVDRYQLFEAAAGGADAVLLIARVLTDEALVRLQAEAEALDLDCLVEVHDGEELERALEQGAEVIGINNRDLDSGAVDVDTTYELMPDVPAGKAVVAESGISDRVQLDELERVGVDAVLIGEALMRAGDPEIEDARADRHRRGNPRAPAPIGRLCLAPAEHAAATPPTCLCRR